jgi:hypothetical protein
MDHVVVSEVIVVVEKTENRDNDHDNGNDNDNDRNIICQTVPGWTLNSVRPEMMKIFC